MSEQTRAVFLATLCGSILLTLFSSTSQADPNNDAPRLAREEYTGTIQGVGGSMGGISRPFTLVIDSYTSNAEATRAVQILESQGQDGLQKEIGKQKLGTFAVSGQLGRDLNFVQESQGAGGRRVTILFERWLNMFEVRYGTRSEDYPFTYIELFVDRSGKGEGTIIPAARIYFDKKQQNQLNVESFGIYPARLSGVKLRNKPVAR